MEHGQRMNRITQDEHPFMEILGKKELSVPTGMYHLVYDNEWRCIFVSDDCLEMLDCSREDFPGTLQASVVFMGTDKTETLVGTILRELALAPGQRLYTGITRHGNGMTRRIKSTLTSCEQDGQIHLYGQVADITQPHQEIELSRTLINEYRTGLEQRGRMIYRYVIDGRRGIVNPAVAKQLGIPEVIDNLPEWNVENGHIAPESTEAWYGIFDAIDRGEKYGSQEIVFRLCGGTMLRRNRVDMIGIADELGNPTAALISYEDITDRYEHDRKQALDRAGLLQAAQMTFPEILSMNLTRGTYRIIQYDSATTLGTRPEGALDQMLLPRLENVAPEDQEAFRASFFLEGQLKAIREGRERIQLTYRRRGADGEWHWMESIVTRQDNPYDDDILTFAVSRNIDEEKARESRLRDQIRQQSEEMNITMSQMGKHISYYDVATSTLITSPPTAKEFGVPIVMENYPESFIDHPTEGYPSETGELLRTFIGAIRRGDPTGSCNYPTVTADGRKVWLQREFVTIFDDSGQPVRAVIASEDVTSHHEHDQRLELDRSGLIKVAQLMFPEILSCNLTRGTCSVIQSVLETPKGIPLDAFLTSRLEDIAPEDHEAFKKQFFRSNQLQAVQAGRERFQLTYRRRGQDGTWHWIETIAVRYENPYNDDILTYAVSRNVDQQKAQEELLRQALAESTNKLEGWLYYNSLSSQSHPGLIYVNYLDGRPSPYTVGTLAKRLDCPPKELALSTCFRIPNEDKGALQLAYEKAKQSGETSFQAEYRVETDRGEIAWIYNHAIHFEDKDGGTGYIHFLTDTTHEHALMEQVRLHMEEKVRENQKVFQVVAQHSNRILYAYDLATGTTRPWDTENAKDDILAHLCTGNDTDGNPEQNPTVLPESIDDVKAFFANIHGGVPSGELNIHIRLADGQPRWYHFRYSSFFTGDKPVTALISIEDITERHEHELAYLRYVQSVDDNAEKNLLYLESCLVCDRVERLSGQILSADERDLRCSHSDFGRLLLKQKFQFEHPGESAWYFSCEHLLASYAQGERQLKSEWEVRFNDDTPHWLDIEVMMTADPFNDHVKAFTRIVDITEARQEQQSLHQRADYDAMTGLLRRGVGEAKIREHLAARTAPGGILIALDLDDLKGINDTLGHAHGDKAISGIADTLKSHFRKDDILIRAGGDEFLVFLPGAGKSVSSVELSVAALLRKLSTIPIGDHDERTIHCSVGCAVALPDTDTFDSLYQRADMALYHVKRSGKNNFAFFEPAMLEENYHFKLKQSQPVVSSVAEEQDLKHLLELISVRYPGIVLFNLTQNHFRILTVGNNVEHVHAPDKVDVFWENWRENIHPDDRDDTIYAMSRNNLLTLYTQGKRSIRRYYRNLETIGYIRTEVSIQFYTTDAGDICAFLFFRWDSGSEKDMEIQRLNKILDLSGVRDFEYICLIDVRNKSYFTFSRDGENSHMIPEAADFDTVTKHIRDTQIPPEARDAYYESAALDHVLKRMGESDGNYSYRYTTTDGITREAVFNWYEDSHIELLMTVRKIT